MNPTKVERIQGFRYPAPGSRGNPQIPLRESSDDIYNTQFYTRDSRNIKNPVC
jgi:hypothetical protein